MSTHIRIDWTRCDGHGVCATLLPDRIELDEWGFPIVHSPIVGDADDRNAHVGDTHHGPARNVVDTHDGDVRRAAAACPALALYREPVR